MASCAPGSVTRAGGKWWLHNIAAPYQQPNFPQQCVCCTAEHWSTLHHPLTSFAPLVVRETAGVVTSFTYGCTTSTAPQLVQLHNWYSSTCSAAQDTPEAGEGQKCAGN